MSNLFIPGGGGGKFCLYIVIFMYDSDAVMSTTCYNNMTRDVNGCKLTKTLTKDCHRSQ